MQYHILLLLVIVCLDAIEANPRHVDRRTRGLLDEIDGLSQIKFPEHIEDDDIPEPCKNLTYCTIKPKNYPENKFNEMFKNYKAVAQPKLVKTVDFNNRQSEHSDDCDSNVTFEPLYTVREKRSNLWRTVVQAPGRDYVQRVRLETCVNEGASCFKALAEFQDSYQTFCQQKYNTWEILVDSKTEQREPELIEAILPVCCSCYYKSIPLLS